MAAAISAWSVKLEGDTQICHIIQLSETSQNITLYITQDVKKQTQVRGVEIRFFGKLNL